MKSVLHRLNGLRILRFRCRATPPIDSQNCGNSSVVEHNLAKVGVASSNLVSRSRFRKPSPKRLGFFVKGRLPATQLAPVLAYTARKGRRHNAKKQMRAPDGSIIGLDEAGEPCRFSHCTTTR